MKKYLIISIVFSFIILNSCSGKLVRVKPYERETFAQDKMLFNPLDARTSYHEHVFSIREASQGGSSSFQGGCGCR